MPSAPFRVLVTEPIHQVGLDLLAQHAEVIRLWEQPGATVEQVLPSVDGVIVRIARITADHLDAAPRLRAIGKHGVGVDNIDLAAAGAQGVPVVVTPGVNDETVAEYTVMVLLMLAREIGAAQRYMRSGQFFEGRRVLRGVDVQGKTLGLVGLGRIGARVAEICGRGLGMRILAFDPSISAERAAVLGVEKRDDLAEMLPACDFVSVHVPLTAKTRGIIGAAEIARMKPGAFLINSARGGLVDESALAEALRAGRLAGAAVDTFVAEPPPPDHPLLTFENVIVSPHIAGQSEDSLRRMASLVADEVLHILHGNPPRYAVQPDQV